jgi:hypothetical protein
MKKVCYGCQRNQILSLKMHLKYFIPKKMKYTAAYQKILEILCILNENKLYPGLIARGQLAT